MHIISKGPLTKEDMVKEYNINEEFREAKKITTNSRQGQQKEKNKDGTTTPVIVELFQTDIEWLPKYGTMMPEWSVELIETLLKEPRQPIDIQETGKEQLMGGLLRTDLHLDELDIKNSTISSRIKTTNERTKRVIDRLIRYDIEKLLIGQMGDLFNSDKGYKTSSGKVTVQNNIHEKDAFRKIIDWTIAWIEELKKLGIPLEYRIVPGNHDELSSYHYGIACEYALGIPVKVDKNRSYIQRGETLIALGHGDNEKPNNFLQFVVDEFLTKYKKKITNLHGYIGNQHKQIISSNGNMLIKNLLAPNTKSTFTNDRGYDMVQRQHGFVWDKKEGEIAEVRG